MHSQGLTIPLSLYKILTGNPASSIDLLLVGDVVAEHTLSPDWYEDPDGYREKLEADLKARGLLFGGLSG